MDYRRILKESEDSTLKDIEREYGPKVAQALVKYCSLKKLDMDDVVGDLRSDGNGMTPWDKFDVWAQKTLGLDIMGNFDDSYDWSGAEERKEQEREREEELADAKRGIRKIRKGQKELKKLKKELKKKKGNRRERFGQVYQAPTDFSTMQEAGGSNPIDEYFISNWIGDEL